MRIFISYKDNSFEQVYEFNKVYKTQMFYSKKHKIYKICIIFEDTSPTEIITFSSYRNVSIDYYSF